MKIMTHISIVALFVAAGIAMSGAQTLTPVGVSLTDPTAVNPVVAGLTDVALGTSAIGSVPPGEVANYAAIPYYATLGGPGVATATCDSSIAGALFGPLGAIDGIIRIDNPANWGGVAYDPIFTPWYQWTIRKVVPLKPLHPSNLLIGCWWTLMAHKTWGRL